MSKFLFLATNSKIDGTDEKTIKKTAQSLEINPTDPHRQDFARPLDQDNHKQPAVPVTAAAKTAAGDEMFQNPTQKHRNRYSVFLHCSQCTFQALPIQRRH